MTIAKRLYDISRTISPALAIWPGDTPFSFDFVLRKAEARRST
jgi:kynurenine formamidase